MSCQNHVIYSRCSDFRCICLSQSAKITWLEFFQNETFTDLLELLFIKSMLIINRGPLHDMTGPFQVPFFRSSINQLN